MLLRTPDPLLHFREGLGMRLGTGGTGLDWTGLHKAQSDPDCTNQISFIPTANFTQAVMGCLLCLHPKVLPSPLRHLFLMFGEVKVHII